MVDWDADGDLDLLVGDSNGYITLYLRDEEGALTNEGHISVDGEELDVGDRAASETVDWDLDGDFDLLVGSSQGTIIIMSNVGSAEEPEFEEQGTIEVDGEELWLGSETAPFLVDLDGDGSRDLIVGSIDGLIRFYPNTGDNDDPRFGAEVLLSDDEGPINQGHYSRPELYDWDGDGDLDLIAGKFTPEVVLFLNTTAEDVHKHQLVAPSVFSFLSTYPEPFNHRVKLSMQIAKPGEVTIDVVSLLGRTVKSLPGHTMTRGWHEINLDFRGLSSGRYIVRVNSDAQTVTRQITFIR